MGPTSGELTTIRTAGGVWAATQLGHSAAMEAAESEIFLGEMRSALTRQRLAETAAREALIRQLGLWGNAARKLTLPSRLPALPASPLDYPSVEPILKYCEDRELRREILEAYTTRCREGGWLAKRPDNQSLSRPSLRRTKVCCRATAPCGS